MKKTLAMVLAIVMSLGLTSCATKAPVVPPVADAGTPDDATAPPADTPVKTQMLRLAFNQTEAHPQYRAMQVFSDNFKAATNGKYEIKLFPNETLGNQRETLEQCQAGTLDLALVNNTHPGSLSDYFKTFDIPFLFKDVEEAIHFMANSPVMEEVKSSTEQYGIRVASYFPAGQRSMYCKIPIKSVADMKDLKIRTMESDVYVKMMAAFGGNATPMAMGELYTAIQSGVVEGAENNEITYVNSKHYEVAPYWSQTNHLVVPDWLIINEKLYNSFTEEEKTAFNEECVKAMDNVAELWDEEVKTLMATLADKDVTITTDVDIKSFEDAVQPLHKELTDSNANIKKVYDSVQALKQ